MKIAMKKLIFTAAIAALIALGATGVSAHDPVRLVAAELFSISVASDKALARTALTPAVVLIARAARAGWGSRRRPRGSTKECGAEQCAQGGAPRSWGTEESGQSVKFSVIHGLHPSLERALKCRFANSRGLCIFSRHHRRGANA